MTKEIPKKVFCYNKIPSFWLNVKKLIIIGLSERLFLNLSHSKDQLKPYKDSTNHLTNSWRMFVFYKFYLYLFV